MFTHANVVDFSSFVIDNTLTPTKELLFYPLKTYSCKWLPENLKARILKSIITWPEVGQQFIQAKKVCHKLTRAATLLHVVCH